MEISLQRQYFKEGCNGALFVFDELLCHTIELPWKKNQTEVSCIPEGRYELKKRYSSKFKWHLEVIGVPHRSLILIHPANNAQQELRGCIAPVMTLTGPGMGLRSRIALNSLKKIIYKHFAKREKVFLTLITSTL